ncbi:hypothetical protein [Nonomuraea jabiensis]|uniref:hypothetical protein n=1 Tax=Nonomuraea jabiensis TaxID=882448 RepID=UPI003D71C661
MPIWRLCRPMPTSATFSNWTRWISSVFVEMLSDISGYRIEEDDYPAFSSVAGGAQFLAAHAGTE